MGGVILLGVGALWSGGIGVFCGGTMEGFERWLKRNKDERN